MLALETSELLLRVSRGDRQVEERLWPQVYGELRRMAANQLCGERPNHTLQTTAPVHEAYVRLIGESGPKWHSRAHLFPFAARVMRQILVDYARERRVGKRGGGNATLPLEEGRAVSTEQCAIVSELDDALQRLEIRSPQQSRVVELRFLGGLSEEEIAQLLGVDAQTVRRELDRGLGLALRGTLKKINEFCPV